MQKTTVELTNEQVEALQHAVENGAYESVDEAAQEAVFEWQCKRAGVTVDAERLRVLWDEGIASGMPTPVDFAEARAEARQRLKARVAQAS